MSGMIAVLVFFPLLAAFLTHFAGKKSAKAQQVCLLAGTGIELILAVAVCVGCYGMSISLPGCGIHFTVDGFRAIYGIISAFMWFVSAVCCPRYFAADEKRGRFYFFFLATLCATEGVFLSADLYTTFLFFEIMTFTSYAWVIQNETPAAMKAGKLYLSIAITGGMATLMGLFMLYRLTGTLMIEELAARCAGVEDRTALYTAAFCILAGFGAKAGLFPLHDWLPAAHPVAPAPASALLSGVLTKTGVFGVLIVTAQIMSGDKLWGGVLFLLGMITLLIGAVRALFETGMKYILAFSSLSQIGFIMVGVGLMALLGTENTLAANGTVLYMMNHSLVKLVLFLLAGVIDRSAGSLDINEIRGYCRNKPLLHVIYLCSAASLSGIPLFCGYQSKTLLHEAIVAYANIGGGLITAAEWLFLLGGGMTLAYLLKIYIAVFVEKPVNPVFRNKERIASAPVLALLTISSLSLAVLGLFPQLSMKIVGAASGFIGSAPLTHYSFFTPENLKGSAISIAFGVIIYLVVIRGLLSKKKEGVCIYRHLWKEEWNIADLLYIPICKGLAAVCSVIARFFADLTDMAILLLRRTVFADSIERTAQEHPLAQRLGQWYDRLRGKDAHTDKRLVKALDTVHETNDKISGSFSFAMLMSCLGVCLILGFIIYIFLLHHLG